MLSVICREMRPATRLASRYATTWIPQATRPQISASTRLTEWVMAECSGSATPIRLPANAVAAATLPCRSKTKSLCGVTRVTNTTETINTPRPVPK